METNLERVDQKLLSIQIELQKLEIIVEHLSRYPPATGDKGLVDTIQHRRERLLGSSQAISERIGKMCGAVT